MQWQWLVAISFSFSGAGGGNEQNQISIVLSRDYSRLELGLKIVKHCDKTINVHVIVYLYVMLLLITLLSF